MVERYGSCIGFITQKSLFCFFTLTSVLFIFSWFFMLSSTGTEYFVNTSSSLPNSKSLDVANTSISQLSNQSSVDPSTGNREILVQNKRLDKEKEKEKEKEEDKVKEATENIQNDCRCETESKPPLKVFMYDMDPMFHFGLLDWIPEGKSVWPDIQKKLPSYPGGLNLQHSIEYWLTLDLLASQLPNHPSARAAVRVSNSSEADCIFVPFFSSLSYNRYSKVKPRDRNRSNKILQDRVVRFVTEQKEWKRSGGRDHVILAHHPNSMLNARMKLWPAMFILSDFGRYPPNIANVEKDVIAPYKHVIIPFFNDASDFDSRPTLMYFQGAIYRKDGGAIRHELYYLLRGEKDVHFSFGSVQKDGIRKASGGMHSSKFCLNIAGDTPSSNRLFDAIASHCVPVIISDAIELPYEDVLDYSQFCVFVRTSDALKKHFLVNLIRGIKKDEWTRMWTKLKEIENMYEFQYPSKEGDAVQMIWQAVARKVPNARRKVHQSWRYSHSVTRQERGGSRALMVPRNFW